MAPPLVSFALQLPSKLATTLSSVPGKPFDVHLLNRQGSQVAQIFSKPLSAASLTQDVLNQLRSASIGRLECSLVHSIELGSLGNPAQEEQDGKRSKLFIARVDSIEEGLEEIAGSLIWCKGAYTTVKDG